MLVATQHVAKLLASPEFAAAPPKAQASVLAAQRTAADAALAELRKAEARLGFLGEEHPAVLSIRAAMAGLDAEADALEATYQHKIGG